MTCHNGLKKIMTSNANEDMEKLDVLQQMIGQTNCDTSVPWSTTQQ